MTRYGYVELTNTASSLGNAGDYLGEIAMLKHSRLLNSNFVYFERVPVLFD